MMLTVVLIGVLLCALFYWRFVLPLYYWDHRKVPNKKGWPVIGKQLRIFLKRISLTEFFIDSYNEFPNERYSGDHQFNRPILVLRDTELIRHFTTKVFESFPNRTKIVNKDVEPLLGRSLLFLESREWRSMRSTLSPAFTTCKIKSMFGLISDCAEDFCDFFRKKGSNITAVNTKDVVSRFTNDVIASCAFGVKCDSLLEKNNRYYLMGMELAYFGVVKFLKLALFLHAPKVVKWLNISLFSRQTGAFFKKLVRDTIEQRERNGIIRPDMIHLLMQAQRGTLSYEKSVNQDTGYATVDEHEHDAGNKKTTISDEDVTAQSLFFYLAGSESASTTLCFLLHELALNLHIQIKLRDEIDAFHKEYDGFTYEAITKMKYLDMVISETLRKWPPVIVLNRNCEVTTTLPAVKPTETDLELTPESTIIIPIIGIHRDPKYFPDPDLFDPERFSEENKAKIVPYSYIPFGTGPRNCIGSRFSLVEMKVFVCHVLKNFEILVVKKTPIKVEFDVNQLNMAPNKGFWVGFKSRTQ